MSPLIPKYVKKAVHKMQFPLLKIRIIAKNVSEAMRMLLSISRVEVVPMKSPSKRKAEKLTMGIRQTKKR